VNNPLLTKNFTAGGTINAYRIIKFGSSDAEVLQAAAVSDSLIGVDAGLGAASGERVDVVVSGAAEVEYGGAVTRGGLLTSDADGKAVAASEDDRIIGVAMQSGVSGDIGSVLLGITGKVLESQTFSDLVTVSSAELLALNATPKELVAAPGAGKAIVLLGATAFLDFETTAYDGIAAGEDLNINYTDGSGDTVATIEATGFLDAVADDLRYVYPLAAAAITPVDNAALVLHMATGEIATGDSPLKIRVDYKIIDTSW